MVIDFHPAASDANLDQLPDHGFMLVALPMKIADGSGGPCRIVAILKE